ncbi:hypothetical protein L484_017995 [Morus notabilis]|uniref:Uncharacterized protein n=2 Tax=Morus notabilis TaxID=981085 RepID=W9R200_9ROSA|nr:hypothetical protein L484_017995 [Morus notabilis]
MALTCDFSPTKIISAEKSSLIIKPISKVLRLKHRYNNIPVLKKTVTPLKITSSFKEKVFEDRSNGIICYADESGEIVCEGYDEGPRYHQQIQRKSSHSRDSEMFDILQQRWINFVRGTELNPAADQKGVAVQGDINCNGFNSFR